MAQTTLEIKVLSNASNAVKGFNETSRAADKVTKSAQDAAGRMDKVAESSDRVASKGAQAAGALGGLGSLIGGPYGAAMESAATATQAAADAGDLLNVVTESAIVKKIKDTVTTAAQTTVTTAQAAATKAATIAQRLFNAAMRANPIGLIITAITIVVGLLVLAYQRSSRFRAIVDTVGRVGKAALQKIIDVSRQVVSWIGDKLGSAARKGKDVVVAAFKAYTTPLRVALDLIKKVVEWIKKIKLPKAVGKIAGLFGAGGPPSGRPPGFGGGGGYAPASGSFGRGGPGDGGFMFPAGILAGRGNVYITVHGVVDPDEFATKTLKLLKARGVRIGGATS